LLIGAVLGALTSLSGFFVYWLLFYIGPTILLACLALFGVVALYKKSPPRWNVLPLVAGFWYPSAFLISMVTGFSGSNSGGVVDILFLAIQCIALMGIGYLLQADTTEETPVIA
jgi:hypothetical protein